MFKKKQRFYRFARVVQRFDTEVLQRDDPDRILILEEKTDVKHKLRIFYYFFREEKLTVVYLK